MALSDCPKCWETPCSCGYENPAVLRVQELEKQVEKLDAVRLAANQLIAGIKHRYHLASDADLTCPHMRQLAKMLEKVNG